jgi:hypothetical protein
MSQRKHAAWQVALAAALAACVSGTEVGISEGHVGKCTP